MTTRTMRLVCLIGWAVGMPCVTEAVEAAEAAVRKSEGGFRTARVAEQIP